MSLAETSAPGGDAPLGPISPREKWGKESLRAFPPKNLPGVLVETCAFLSPALDGSGHIDGIDILWVVPASL